MSRKPDQLLPNFDDPDEAPPWSDDVLDRAELAHGGKVIRPATGTLTRDFAAEAREALAEQSEAAAVVQTKSLMQRRLLASL